MTHKESSPFEIRFKLLDLAESILRSQIDRQSQEIMWSAEKTGAGTITLPKYSVTDVINQAKLLKTFVDEK